jgi:hypothetical protein
VEVHDAADKSQASKVMSVKEEAISGAVSLSFRP